MAARPAPSTLIDEIVEVFDPLGRRLRGNLSRVRHLLAIYQLLYGRGRGRRTVFKTDLLRAAVVFLHATLEDCLRSVARFYLPQADLNTLNKIPLAGTHPIRAEKFPLGSLIEHRGKTVDDLINESITQHLERRSFNDTADISRLLEESASFLEANRADATDAPEFDEASAPNRSPGGQVGRDRSRTTTGGVHQRKERRAVEHSGNNLRACPDRARH